MIQNMKPRLSDNKGFFLDKNIDLGFILLSVFNLRLIKHMCLGKYLIYLNGFRVNNIGNMV